MNSAHSQNSRMSGMKSGIRIFVFLTLLTGVAYPLLVTALGQVLFPDQANGSIITRNGQKVGSELIGQKLERPQHFWARPSATDYNPLPSGGSNLGPTSQDLKAKIEERVKQGSSGDLLFTSASGLDPHISLNDALSQAPRVSQALERPLPEVVATIHSITENRQLGFLGERRVNVLRLNLALSEEKVR